MGIFMCKYRDEKKIQVKFQIPLLTWLPWLGERVSTEVSSRVFMCGHLVCEFRFFFFLENYTVIAFATSMKMHGNGVYIYDTRRQ